MNRLLIWYYFIYGRVVTFSGEGLGVGEGKGSELHARHLNSFRIATNPLVSMHCKKQIERTKILTKICWSQKKLLISQRFADLFSFFRMNSLRWGTVVVNWDSYLGVHTFYCTFLNKKKSSFNELIRRLIVNGATLIKLSTKVLGAKFDYHIDCW